MGVRTRWLIIVTVAVFYLELFSQQFTYGVASEGVFAESLRKFCRHSAENLQKFRFNASSAESLRKFRGNLQNIFCNDPFPNDPISELLTFSFLLRLPFWLQEDLGECLGAT